jgi:hypothetical protein
VQIAQLAQVIIGGSCEVFATPINTGHVKSAMESKKATFKKDLDRFGFFHGRYVPVDHGATPIEMK